VKYRLVITPRALADLRSIRDYIASRSPDNAARFLHKVLDQLEVIGQSPQAFGKAPEDRLVSYALHQVVIKPYRILYRVQGRRVEILHVRHGARLPVPADELK